MIYLDNAATTPIDDEVFAAMEPYLRQKFGNANAQYSLGREAANAVIFSRDKVSKAFGCLPHEVYFTSGATEAANTILRGVCAKHRKGHMVISAIEHHAVIECAGDLQAFGFDVTYVKPDSKGIVSSECVKNALREDTVLCAVMAANNEVGTIQPVEEIGKLCKERGIFYYCDCVQGVGEIAFPTAYCDAFAVSAHKFYGPKGVGALYLKEGSNISRLISGGAQERSFRGGTTNVAGIVGLAEALSRVTAYGNTDFEKIRWLRDKFVYRVVSEIDCVRVNGDRTARLSGNANLSFKDCDGQNIVMLLDMKGVAASIGAACSAGAASPSHVLTAMGLSRDRVRSAVRFTLGKHNTEEEIYSAVEILKKTVKKIRGDGWNKYGEF